MALTPEEVQKFHECDILELRKELKDSNKNRTFARSQALDKIIKDRSSSEIDQAVKSVLKTLDQELDEAFKEYQDCIEQITDDFKNNENYLRISIDDSFAELKERQLQSLTDVEVQKDSELLREDRRETATVQRLRTLATRYADQGNFEQAMKVDNEANEIHQKEIDDQAKVTNIRYQKRVDKLLIQFGTEIDVLDNKLLQLLDTLNTQKNNEIVNQQKKCSVVVQRLLLAAINDANKRVKKIELQPEISNRLTSYVRKKANDNGMNRKLQFD